MERHTLKSLRKAMEDMSYLNIVDSFSEINGKDQDRLSPYVDEILKNENFMYLLEEFHFSQHVSNSIEVRAEFTDEIENLLSDSIEKYGTKDLKELYLNLDVDFIKVMIFSFELKLRVMYDFFSFIRGADEKKEGA
jgi:hypothetical protein